MNQFLVAVQVHLELIVSLSKYLSHLVLLDWSGFAYRRLGLFRSARDILVDLPSRDSHVLVTVISKQKFLNGPMLLHLHEIKVLVIMVWKFTTIVFPFKVLLSS